MRTVFEIEPDWEEQSRRVRAAMAYAKMDRSAAARAFGTSPGTFDRIIGTKGKAERKLATWKELADFAERCDLPREWFYADFSRLGEIVTEPLVTQSGGAAGAARTARARRALEQIEEEAQRQREAQLPPGGRSRSEGTAP